MKTKKLTVMALTTALAMILSFVESQIPAFVAVLLVAALALFFGLRSRQARDTGTGAQAVVTVDGREIGRYPLKKNGTFPLNGGTNILVVENGEAWVSEANCPDKVCMGMGKISRNGEFIACLPNRLIVVVEGGEQNALVDGMT